MNAELATVGPLVSSEDAREVWSHVLPSDAIDCGDAPAMPVSQELLDALSADNDD